MAEPFITTAQLEAYLRLPADSLTGDLLAEMCVGSACETLRQMTNQDLDAVADDVVMVSSPGMTSLVLPDMPVWHVSGVKLAGVEVSTDRYRFDRRNGILWMIGGVWIAGRLTYEVTYSHGYGSLVESGSGGDGDEAPPYPADLVMLAVTMAARIYDQGLVQQESTGGYQVIFSAPSALGLTDREMDIVAKYTFGRDVGLDRTAQV